MADLDFITDLTNGDFKVSLTENPMKVTGNRALLNRFEIVFLTQAKAYLLGDVEAPVIDNFGGGANLLISRPTVLNDLNAITGAITIAIERTVKSMQRDQPDNTPDNEKLLSAELLNIYIQDGIIMATVKVDPLLVDSYDTLVTNLPIIKR